MVLGGVIMNNFTLFMNLEKAKDEFIKCYGLGEKIYNKCGEELLMLIKNYKKD